MTETGRNKLAKWFKIVALSLAGVLFLLHVFIFVLFNVVEKLKQDYLYLTVYDSEVFIITILITLVLPALVGLGCCFFLKIRRWPIRIFLVVVSLVLLAGMLFSSFFVQFGGGGIASYTEKMDDYGRYDPPVCRAVEACSLEGFFPDKEDLKESSQYRYFYDYGSIDELYYIQLDAHFTAEKYAAEKARLEHQYTEMVSFSEETLYQHYHKIPGGVVTAAVCMDDAENRILYKVFRSENESLANDGVAELAGMSAAPSPGGESSPESVPPTDSDGEFSPEPVTLTVSDAETIVKNNLPQEEYELYVEFQSEQTIEDRVYYYFLVYSLGSEPLTGDQGTYYQQFTYAWAYVDALTGELYEMLVSGKGLRPWLGQSPDSLDLDYKIKSDTDVVLANNTYAQKWYGLSAYYLGRLIEADLEDSVLFDSKAAKKAINDIHQHWESYAGKRIKNEETLVQWKYEKSSTVEEMVSKYTYDLYRAHALEMYFFCSNVEMEGLGTAADVDNTFWTFVAEIDEQEATVQDHISLDAEYTQAFKESYSNADKAQTKERYAEKWLELSEQYVNRILQGDFDSRIKETVETIHRDWKAYADKRVDYELTRLQIIYGSASTVSGAIAGFEYDLYRAHALEMSRLCRMLSVDFDE